VRIDLRGSNGDAVTSRKAAAELVARKPDVILAMGSLSVTALQEATRTVPIVFTLVADPVGAGFVESLRDLPVQAPNKYFLVINRKTYQGIGIE
jgi:putative ABC transport system substrate-binding protein